MKLGPNIKASLMLVIESAVRDFPDSAPHLGLPKQITAGPFLVLLRERFAAWAEENCVNEALAVEIWEAVKQQVLKTCSDYTTSLQ